MAIGPAVMDFYTGLAVNKVIYPGQTICELGSQDLMELDGYDAEMFFQLMNARAELVGSSRDFMTAMGFVGYQCIDLDGRHGAVPHDLNVARYEDESIKFDLVTNLGTIEHVFNQANCFQLVHDLTKVGSVMLHVGPIGSERSGWNEHGFYLHTHGLFNSLARANDYEILCKYEVDHRDGTLIMVALKRITTEPFKAPIQYA